MESMLLRLMAPSPLSRVTFLHARHDHEKRIEQKTHTDEGESRPECGSDLIIFEIRIVFVSS
jgi:hypothetical protein